MIGWNFPLNDYGQEYGLNDAGIETFKGNPWGSLAREVIQNSLDAGLPNSGRPVEVHFRLHHLSAERFPGRDSFIAVLEACRDYWKSSPKAKKFFDRAIEIMRRPQIPVLKISDYNTTGLTGSDRDHGSDWHKLIKSVGTSDKGGRAGGSYGIGKHAPFACSLLRTVFYATKDIKGLQAFQGVARLVTHLDRSGRPTQGTGYYGIRDRNRPITDMSLVDQFFRRSEVGTDLFIFGFSEVPDWQVRIIKSAIENFFVAVLDGNLVIMVEGERISKETLSGLIDKYISQDPECLAGKYCEALLSPHSRRFTRDKFIGSGSLELIVLPKKDFPKKVAMVRATGMKIFDKGHFHTPLKFAGVLLAKGDELNEFLRALEPPGHDAWQPERYEEDEAYARKKLKELYAWMNDCVRELLKLGDDEKMDVEGMSQYLPDDLDEPAPMDQEGGAEGIPSAPREVDVVRVEAAGAGAVTAGGREAAAADEGGEGYIPAPEGRPNAGVGGFPRTREGRTSGSGAGGSTSEAGRSAAGAPRHIRLKNVRAFCADPDKGIYKVSFETDFSGRGYLHLSIVGEDGSEPAPIREAAVVAADVQVGIDSSGRIGPIEFKAGARTALLVTLSEPIRCSLEVYGFAD
ncbi:hypothetical protein [Desulfovirgula thermocuniculi]|uniref:hypothetical protein n=1 Tax=Desulfovirgula thermocuniculi TaxID=348842 RepID=UPI00041895A4|nr:hypothetical protein [Desulfovirgula thermocuniculi]